MYIVGIDIAKRFHEAAIINQVGKIIVKRIRFANFNTGFLKLMDAVKKLDAPSEFGMEATGHYWLPLYAHLRQAGLFMLSILCSPTPCAPCLSVRPRTTLKTR